jgi:hypothetical protein
MLSIYISRNNFGNRKKDYIYRSRNCGIITQDMFIKMIAGANTTVTEPDTIAVMTLIEQKFDELINTGFAVQLPMGIFRAGASGTAESTTDCFRPKSLYSKDAKKTDHTISLLFESNRKKKNSKQGQSLSLHGEYLKIDFFRRGTRLIPLQSRRTGYRKTVPYQ